MTKDMLKAVRDLCPKPGSDTLSSVEIIAGGKTVTLTSDTRERLNKQLADWKIRPVKLTGNTQEMVEKIRKELKPMTYRETCEKCHAVIDGQSEAEMKALKKAHRCQVEMPPPGKPLPSLPAPVLEASERKRKAAMAVEELKLQIADAERQTIVGALKATLKAQKAGYKQAGIDLDTSCAEAGQGTLFDKATGEVAG